MNKFSPLNLLVAAMLFGVTAGNAWSDEATSSEPAEPSEQTASPENASAPAAPAEQTTSSDTADVPVTAPTPYRRVFRRKQMSNCQSCGMPMKKDPEGGGTDADGTRSTEYCSFCYSDGAFTQPDFSAEDMQKFCVQKMKECNVPGPLAWLFTRGIPRLRRWSA